jgi:hypothetical protein
MGGGATCPEQSIDVNQVRFSAAPDNAESSDLSGNVQPVVHDGMVNRRAFRHAVIAVKVIPDSRYRSRQLRGISVVTRPA